MEAVVAVDKTGIIGAKDQGLLWHSKKDLQWFKHITMNKGCVFGTTTYNTLPKQPLPKRDCYILSHTKKSETIVGKHRVVYLSKDDLLNTPNKYIVCGGASIYRLLEPYITTLWLTEIDKIYTPENPIYFPNFELDTWDHTCRKQTTDIIDGKETNITIHKYTRLGNMI